MHIAYWTNKLVNLPYQVTFKCLCHMPVLLSKCIPIVLVYFGKQTKHVHRNTNTLHRLLI